MCRGASIEAAQIVSVTRSNDALGSMIHHGSEGGVGPGKPRPQDMRIRRAARHVLSAALCVFCVCVCA